MDGRTHMVGVVTLPMASPDGSGVVLVPRYGVFCCSTGMGIYFSPFWGIDVDFGVRVTRGGALNRLGRRGAERWNSSCAASDVQQHQRHMGMRVLMKPHC